VERDDQKNQSDVLLTQRHGNVLVLACDLIIASADAKVGLPEVTSADALEGARAFAERRPPVWTGK
jgi:enoyl-CoA hydratase/carnithine racemase